MTWKLLKWYDPQKYPDGTYPWDEWIRANAAIGGHLEVLKWLHDPNLPDDGPKDFSRDLYKD